MKRRHIVIFLICISNRLILLSQSTAVSNGRPPVSGYQLIWSDEFNGSALDRTKWGFHGLGKRGDAYNTTKAVRLDRKGHLVIEASIQGDSIHTGIIHTANLFETRYGYFECRAALTRTTGIWPAFWLQSSKNTDGGTPEANGVEIDIFEYFRNDRADAVSHALHWAGYGSTHKMFGPFYSPLKPTEDRFHTFGLEWTPSSYAIYVDGVKTNEGTTYISQVAQYILLSLEVNKNVAGLPSLVDLPDSFVVDYVRVYKKR
ncbi:MAG: glycoside hydrolase family 16 protein [Chitinophagaceae bacterium]|nr:glycoside hydrolase family 16 protein [Chitinophagaceae bacterium]